MKPTTTEDPTKADAGALALPRSLAKTEPIAIALPVTRNERMLGSAAYLSAFSGFWLVVPAAIYFLKGRQSRFLGFHAIQAVILQVALIPFGAIGIGVALAIGAILEQIGGRLAPLAVVLVFTIIGLTAMLPFAVTLWLGLSALRGKPRALPIIGRWAARVVSDD